MFTLPKLYAILDAETCARRGYAMEDVAKAWLDGGVQWIQYRDKQGSDAEVLQTAAVLRALRGSGGATLILNDRVHLFAETAFDGIHVGQTDTAVAAAREFVGPNAVLGISTHNPRQLANADGQPVTYVAIGPVFATGTKADADPVVGLDGVRAACALTRHPLVAIGGITRQNAAEVLAAGADSVAVISGLLPPAGSPVAALNGAARDFLAALK